MSSLKRAYTLRILAIIALMIALSFLVFLSLRLVSTAHSIEPTSTSGLTESSLSKPSRAGDALASAGVALGGSDGWAKAAGSTYKQRHRSVPPNVSAQGNWTVYNQVYNELPKPLNVDQRDYHAQCSQTVRMAVQWSGVDDSFSSGFSFEQFRHMELSPRWKRVGVYNRILLEGTVLQPGDVLVTTKCAQGRYGHICIYVGNQHAQKKFPGTSAAVLESYEARYWPSLTPLYQSDLGENNVEYYVYRPTEPLLSQTYSSYLYSEKQRYSIAGYTASSHAGIRGQAA